MKNCHLQQHGCEIKSDKDKYHITYVESKIRHKRTYETETVSQTENKLMIIKGEKEWGKDTLGVWN